MAEAINIADLEAPASPKAISIDSLEPAQQAAPQGISIDSLESEKSYPVGQPQKEPDMPIEDKATKAIVENIPDSFKYMARELGSYLHTSPINTALQYLQVPQTALTATVVKGLDVTGIDKGIQSRLNPNGEILPKGLSPHDVLYDFLPTNQRVYEKAKELADKFGIGNWAADSTRLTYAITKGGLGLTADIFGDPITYATAGLGKAAELGAQGIEALSKTEQAASIARGASKVAKVAEEAPVVGSVVYAGKGVVKAGSDVATGAAQIWKSLLPYTGIKDIDENWVLHSGMSKAIAPATKEEVYGPIKNLGISSSEGEVLFDALENVKNSVSKEELSAQIGKSAQKNKLSLSSERTDQLADAGIHLRDQLEKNIQREIDGGLRSPFYGKEIEESPGKLIRVGVLEGYVPHRMSDEARAWAMAQVKAGKNPSEIINSAIREEMTKAGVEFDKGVSGSWVSDFDVGQKTRTIRAPVQDANNYLKNSTGIDKFFVTDPILATAYKVAETKKTILDKGLLDVVKKYGLDAAKAPRGWKPIEHTALSLTENMRFPPEIADKIGFYLSRPDSGLLLSKLDQYQWLFKRLALAKPDYYLQNIGENSVKAMALGASPRDFSYATKIMSGKGVIPLKEGSITAQEMRNEIIKYGIDSGGIFKEGFDSLIHMGKTMTRDGILSRVKDAPAKTLSALMEMGESGENWSRRALYISLRRSGLVAKDAALTVERVMFDYGRVTPAMNTARRFVPFIQPVIKTAAIVPELLRKNPRLYNFLNNNMFQAMQAAFNDPVTNSELYATMGKSISSRYKQLNDPTFSVLLPGNSWLSKYLVNKGPNGIPNEGTPFQGQAGGNVLFQLKAPIQFDLLNQFMVFSDETGSVLTGVGAGPLVRAFTQFFAGKDLFTGKEIDVSKDYIDIAARTNAAANTLIEGVIPFPNALKMVKRWAGIGDPKWIEPASVLAIQGTVGRFAAVTNLDKDFFFRMVTMKKYHEELLKEFMSRAASEQRNAPAPDAPSQIGAKIRKWSQIAFSSERAHKMVLENAAEMQRMNMARAGIIGQMKPEEIIRNIKMIEKNVKELNHSYQTISEFRLKAIGDAKVALDQIQGKSQEPEESDSE